MRFRSLLWLSVLAGCPDRNVGALTPSQETVEVKNLPAVPNRDVDILFVIDDSLSMAEEQASLRANFSKFMDVLETIEGGLPNVHIGVTTSNLGQSASDGVGNAPFGSSCAGSGNDGGLRTGPSVSGRFIVDEEGGGTTRNRNYTGTLADAFAELADVGTGGCGIEQHLGAAQRALSNTANAGFLRDEAKLALIIIGDEDDCSLSHKALFEGSTDGTVVNFRCTQEGIECDGDPDLTHPGVRTNCHPKIDSPYVAEVDGYVDYVRSLKPLPDENVIVAGIVGNPDPVEIALDDAQHAILKPSCTYSGQFAYPAVRTADFLSQFTQSIREPICEADLSGALVQIGALLKRSFGDPCFENELADRDPDTSGLQAECSISDYRQLPDGTNVELAQIPACGAGAIPCWRIEEDADRCYYTSTHMKLVIDRGGVIPPSDMFVRVNCVTAGGDGQVQ